MAILEIEGLTHAFGGLVALKDFHLSVAEGEIVGIIGPNGAGKTTIFNLVTGVYRPSRGRILFSGHSLVGLPPHRIARLGVARTFQTIRLYGNLSVLDNVRIGHHFALHYGVVAAVVRSPSARRQEEAIERRSLQLLEQFGLADHAGMPARALPYGLQRRLEMARAVASGPRLLLLDEPAAGMNPRELLEMASLIRWVREAFGVTVVLIEHHMQLVDEVCQRVVALDFGEVIAEGTPRAVQSNPRVLQAYLGTQKAG